MTYCVGIMTRSGLVMASDSRTNSGFDQVNICRKMHVFARPGERIITILTSGGVSLTQSILTLLRRDFKKGLGLAGVATLYEAVRVVGEQVRIVAEQDREALERDKFEFNVHLLVGGQIRGDALGLYMVYPQGNPLAATEDSPYLQIGECKYGRPILDRGIRYDQTTLEEAAKYALISLDSTMRSNVTVGPPLDMMIQSVNDLQTTRHRHLTATDPDLREIHVQWDQALRRAIQELPAIRFEAKTH